MLLTATTGTLHLAASDTEVHAADTAAAEVADEGRALVPGRLLNDICSRLPKGADVDLELVDKGTRLAVASRACRFTLPVLPLNEYPALPALPGAVATVPASTLARTVAQVAVAAGADQTLPALTGIQLRLEGEQLRMSATDRYRIARHEVPLALTAAVPKKGAAKRRKPEPGEGPDPAAEAAAPQALVPARALSEAARALDGEHDLTLHWSEGLFGLSTPGGRSYTTRVLSGYQFPKTDFLLEDFAAVGTWTLPVAEAAAALQRVALVATRNTPVLLVLDGVSVRIEAGSGDDARGSDRVPVNAAGELGDGFTIAFNPGYLADALKALDAPEAELHITKADKPVLLLPRLGEGAQTPYQHLLMPVRLNH